jgi:glycosyltransferase involved in cell wall biosynthesis
MLDRVVFVHDHRFLRAPDGLVYSSRGRWPWDDYLAFARQLTVVSRMEDIPPGVDVATLELSSDPRVAFATAASLSGPLLQFRNRPAAKRALDAEIRGADAVIARLPSELGTLATRRAGTLGKPWAVEVVTCAWDSLWNYGTWQGKVYAPIAWWRTRAVLRAAPFALYVTERFLQRRYPSRGRTVAVSDVELPRLDEAVLAARRGRIHSRPSPARLGVIAALSVKFKGVQTALEALGSLRDRLPPFELRVLGSGNPAPWSELAADHGVADVTHFDGTLPPGDAVLRWLDEVDLYLQPSFQEGLPRSLVEAASRGCPALGSTAGGIPEVLPSECLHRPGDARRLAELIAAGLEDEDWQTRQAERNFATARKYEAEALAARRGSFWREFAASAE